MEYKIEIDKEGNVTIDAIGFKGPICLNKIKNLIDTLGITVELKKKPEFEVEEKVVLKEKNKLQNYIGK